METPNEAKELTPLDTAKVRTRSIPECLFIFKATTSVCHKKSSSFNNDRLD